MCCNAKEVVKDAAMITGTLLIHSPLVITLFNYSCTHAFIAMIFNNRIGMLVEDLGYDLVVSTLVGAILITEVCVMVAVVLIQQHILLTDFTMFLMRVFNVIYSAWIG